jgi:hypothetical protein
MGLDMYLSASKYVGNWSHSDKKETDTYGKISNALGLEGLTCAGSPSMTIDVTVAYWRKANSIHQWFVTNVQDNSDNCGKFYVEREALNALVRDCKEVISERNKGNDQKVAMATLPPQPGFFFGSTDIDEDYYEDIENTINQLESILNNPKLKDFDFYYQASW